MSDTLALHLGMAGAAIGVLIARHFHIYVKLISHVPLAWAIHAWVRIHILSHPPDAVWKIVNAAILSSADNPAIPAARRR